MSIAAIDGSADRWSPSGDRTDMQSTRPRDFGALFLVVGMFAILLVVSLTLGSPALR
jgi:hypothetical protein